MSTSQIALDQVAERKLPFWKLYRGSDRIAQCDLDENPEQNPDEALKQLEVEIESRRTTPGSYYVNTYRKSSGEKGGFKYYFTIHANEAPMTHARGVMQQPDDLYNRVARDIKIEMMLERIETKVDAIGKYITTQATSDKEDDNEGFKMIMQIFGQAMKAKTAAATPAIASNGFSSLK